MDCVYRLWNHSSVFEIHLLNDFMTAIGTNNDVEEWLNILKQGWPHEDLYFYHFVSVLYMGATDISLYLIMVSEGKMQRAQRKRPRQSDQSVAAALREVHQRQSVAGLCIHLRTTSSVMYQKLRDPTFSNCFLVYQCNLRIYCIYNVYIYVKYKCLLEGTSDSVFIFMHCILL